jgi:putative YhbY family RNA-binding protein
LRSLQSGAEYVKSIHPGAPAGHRRNVILWPMKIELSPEQRRKLRADAHHLDPVVMIGNDGLTPAVLHEIDVNLSSHGLIKILVFSDDREARDALLAQIADELDAAGIQHIGKLLVLWRPLPEPEKKSARKAARTRDDSGRNKTARQKLPAGRAPRGVPRAPGEARRTRAQTAPGIPGRRRPRSQP